MRRLLLLIAVFFTAFPALADDKADAVNKLIPWLLDETEALKGIRFADVIAATSGKKVIAIEPKDKDDQRVLAQVGTALDAVLAAMNAPDSKTRGVKRVPVPLVCHTNVRQPVGFPTDASIVCP